jgi:beta-phosphoglucomutase-like phosphatase (HAD superfamily)
VAGKFRLRATSALSRTQLASFFPPLVSARKPNPDFFRHSTGRLRDRE